MNLPSSVQVGPHSYAILTGPNYLTHRCRGKTDYAELKVQIDANLPNTVEQEALLYQTLLALTCLTGNHPDHGTSFGEAMATIAPLLLDTLRRNPDLVAYLIPQETPANVVTLSDVRRRE